MPYVLLIIGLMLGLYGLIRFADKATTTQMKLLFEAATALLLCLILLYLIVTEKLALIVLWLIVALPFFILRWRKWKLEKIKKKD